MTTEEWLKVVRGRRHSKQDLERMVADDKAVIDMFYDELICLGIMPVGLFVWDAEGVRQFAQGILNAAMKAIGSRGGKKGGPARAAKMTKEQRSEVARIAARARWARKSMEEIGMNGDTSSSGE